MEKLLSAVRYDLAHELAQMTSRRPAHTGGRSLLVERTMNRDPSYISDDSSRQLPPPRFFPSPPRGSPRQRCVLAGRCFNPRPETPLPSYYFLVFRPASSDAILSPERSPMKREEAMS